MLPRTYWSSRIEAAWRERTLVWLYGVRRVGKTILCQSLPRVEYFDCELPSARRSMRDPEAFLRSLAGKRVVLDEIHRLTDPTELLKIAADHHRDVRIIATGSSTLQASSRFRDTLTGRKAEVWLTPMIGHDLEDFGSADLVHRLGAGGLPPFFLADEPPERDFQEWVDSYWAKDIQELFRLERHASFIRFVELLLAQSGGIFEATRFAAPAEVSRTTISNYLAVLEATKVAHVVRPFSTRRSTEIITAPKVYAFDTGFVRYFRGWAQLRPEDLGILWEHYVLNELQGMLPTLDIRYWRSTRHHEVDFVIPTRGGAPMAIECKWSADGNEDLPGLRAFRRAYPDGPNFVVASNVQRSFARGIDRTEVSYVSLAELVERLAPPSGVGQSATR